MQENYEEMLTQVKERLEDYLKEAVSGGEGPAASLWEAMRYSLLAGGKRIRPLLLILTGRSLGAPEEDCISLCGGIGDDSHLFADS